MTRLPGILLAADWGKWPKKRAVYRVDVARRAIERLVHKSWSLDELLAFARIEVERGNGPVIISLDLVLGTSTRYFQAVQGVPGWEGAANFVDWLSLLASTNDFWQNVKKADDWHVRQPFFSVPKGPGSLNAFYQKAGYDLFRRVDRRCHSKCPFIVSGIPGTVGSGTRCLWQELAPLLGNNRDFKIWPFEGPMSRLLEEQKIILAENYPGISYTSAIAPSLPSAQILVSKTKSTSRALAIELLENSKWVKDFSVLLPDLGPARGSEDDFDALMTAAGELRCILERRELEGTATDDPISEGGMLLTSAVDFTRQAGKLTTGGIKTNRARKAKENGASSKRSRFTCPIPGCQKVFLQTRGGWDSHVGALSQHPNWHPNIRDREQRLKLFRDEFPSFFG